MNKEFALANEENLRFVSGKRYYWFEDFAEYREWLGEPICRLTFKEWLLGKEGRTCRNCVCRASLVDAARSIVREYLLDKFWYHLLELVDELLGIVAACLDLAQALLPYTRELGTLEQLFAYEADELDARLFFTLVT